MKKLISILLLMISVSCFGQDSLNHNIQKRNYLYYASSPELDGIPISFQVGKTNRPIQASSLAEALEHFCVPILWLRFLCSIIG